MIDSRDKRASILGFALAALAILPAPAGTPVDAGSRAQLAYSYNSETAVPPTPEQPPPVVFVVNRFPAVPSRRPITGDCAVTAKRPVLRAIATVRIAISVRSGPKSSGSTIAAVGTIDRPHLAAALVPRVAASVASAGGIYRAFTPHRIRTPQTVRGHLLLVAQERTMSALAEIGRPTLTGVASVTAASATVMGQGDDV